MVFGLFAPRIACQVRQHKIIGYYGTQQEFSKWCWVVIPPLDRASVWCRVPPHTKQKNVAAAYFRWVDWRCGILEASLQAYHKSTSTFPNQLHFDTVSRRTLPAETWCWVIITGEPKNITHPLELRGYIRDWPFCFYTVYADACTAVLIRLEPGGYNRCILKCCLRYLQ